MQRDYKDGLWHCCILYLENLIGKFYLGLPGENTRGKKLVTGIYRTNVKADGTNAKVRKPLEEMHDNSKMNISYHRIVCDCHVEMLNREFGHFLQVCMDNH